jgi:hypothetical protein
LRINPLTVEERRRDERSEQAYKRSISQLDKLTKLQNACVNTSIPEMGVTSNMPGTGGPFVVTAMAAKPLEPEEDVQVRVNVIVARCGRELAAITRFTG